MECEFVAELSFPFKIIFNDLIKFPIKKTTQNSISPTPHVKKIPNHFD
jgi:hypothetical protein